MAYTNKESFERTQEMTEQIISEVENYVAKQKARKSYSYHKFWMETGVTHQTWDNIRSNKNRSMTLDTAIRLLDKCGLRLKITPKLMPRSQYDHKDIIPPSEYETSGE